MKAGRLKGGKKRRREEIVQALSEMIKMRRKENKERNPIRIERKQNRVSLIKRTKEEDIEVWIAKERKEQQRKRIVRTE